jgi:hypothetical protein
MTTQTTLEQINDLYEIAEYMDDPELTVALETVARLITRPDAVMGVVAIELVRLQAIAAKLSLKATWMANVDKSNRAKKNLYYTAAAEIDKVCSSLKYLTKG